MKKIIFLSAVLFALCSTAAYSQKYKNASDSFKLNKEYASVNKDVADLQAKLAAAQSDLHHKAA